MSATYWEKPFRVRSAGTLTGLGVSLLGVSQVVSVLALLVWADAARRAFLSDREVPPDWTYLLALGVTLGTAGLVCVVVGFVKLCTNVEFLARREADRQRGGR